MSDNTKDRPDLDPNDDGLDRYLGFLDHLDMTVDQKREYLKSLSSVLQTFIDQAFDSTDENVS